MRRVLTAFCLTALVLIFLACGTPPPAPGPGSQPTVEVTAEKLAQDFTDDQPAASQRYAGKTLLITGKIGRLTKPRRYDQDPGPNDELDMILFFVPVTNKQTGEKTQFELRCQFRSSLPAEQWKSLGLEKGKQVTLRAGYEAGYRNKPLAGFGSCSVVRVGEP